VGVERETAGENKACGPPKLSMGMRALLAHLVKPNRQAHFRCSGNDLLASSTSLCTVTAIYPAPSSSSQPMLQRPLNRLSVAVRDRGSRLDWPAIPYASNWPKYRAYTLITPDGIRTRSLNSQRAIDDARENITCGTAVNWQPPRLYFPRSWKQPANLSDSVSTKGRGIVSCQLAHSDE